MQTEPISKITNEQKDYVYTRPVYTLFKFCIIWKVIMHVLYVSVSEGFSIKYIYLGSFWKVVLVKFM